MNQKDLDQYAELMHEARVRLNVLKDFLSGKANTIYVRTNTESMCLQLRKILELIAFSALVSQRDAYTIVRQDIAKDWHALRILKAVEKVNASFYPRPVSGWKKKNGGMAGFNFIRGGYLSRVQFKKLYDGCGDLLHSTNPFTLERNFSAFSKKIPFWVDRIEILLSQHTIVLAASSELLWVQVPMNLDDPVVVQHVGLG